MTEFDSLQLTVGLQRVAHFHACGPFQAELKPSPAFWTSTYEPGCGSDWVRWCVDQEILLETLRLGTLIRVKATARVLTLDTRDKLESFIDQYGVEPPHRGSHMDWAAVFRLFDGVRVTRDLLDDWSVKMSCLFVYAWDVESTAWGNTDHLEIVGSWLGGCHAENHI